MRGGVAALSQRDSFPVRGGEVRGNPGAGRDVWPSQGATKAEVLFLLDASPD